MNTERVPVAFASGAALFPGVGRFASESGRRANPALSLDHRGHGGGGDGDNRRDTDSSGSCNGNGSGCGNGDGNGHRGGNGNNDGDGESGGDDGFGHGRPLLLAGAGSGVAGALDRVKEAVRNLRLPWIRKVSPGAGTA